MKFGQRFLYQIFRLQIQRHQRNFKHEGKQLIKPQIKEAINQLKSNAIDGNSFAANCSFYLFIYFFRWLTPNKTHKNASSSEPNNVFIVFITASSALGLIDLASGCIFQFINMPQLYIKPLLYNIAISNLTDTALVAFILRFLVQETRMSDVHQALAMLCQYPISHLEKTIII